MSDNTSLSPLEQRLIRIYASAVLVRDELQDVDLPWDIRLCLDRLESAIDDLMGYTPQRPPKAGEKVA